MYTPTYAETLLQLSSIFLSGNIDMIICCKEALVRMHYQACSLGAFDCNTTCVYVFITHTTEAIRTCATRLCAKSVGLGVEVGMET